MTPAQLFIARTTGQADPGDDPGRRAVRGRRQRILSAARKRGCASPTVLRDKVLKPLLAASCHAKLSPKPDNSVRADASRARAVHFEMI